MCFPVPIRKILLFYSLLNVCSYDLMIRFVFWYFNNSAIEIMFMWELCFGPLFAQIPIYELLLEKPF